MSATYSYDGEGLSGIEGVLDTVKTARYGLGTASHMGEELERSLEGLRDRLVKVTSFFSVRRHITLAAIGVVLAAALANLARGWLSARHLSKDITRVLSRLGACRRITMVEPQS